MTSNIQLISLFISFLFGIIFYYLTIINFKIIDNLKKYLIHLITAIYVLDITIIYVIIIYKINKGYFHIYFIVMVLIGYFVGYITNYKILCKINVKSIINKLKK